MRFPSKFPQQRTTGNLVPGFLRKLSQPVGNFVFQFISFYGRYVFMIIYFEIYVLRFNTRPSTNRTATRKLPPGTYSMIYYYYYYRYV